MERFGPYILLQRIGAGGMCEVFRARREDGERDVALKRLLPQMVGEPGVQDLFLTEADIGVLLHHPNLINSLESDEVDDTYFIAMELIDGLDLARARLRAIDRGCPIELPLAVYITVELCKGLDYLHNACSPAGRHFQLVHRDVSPDNIFLTRAGAVKLADFGIAKVGKLESVTSVLGGVKGKVGYMAPEQIRGEELDGRTDMFAAALILYELVTGLKPYEAREGETEVEVAMRVREADIPSAIKLEPDIPPALDQALRKALHKKPKKRFASCADFAFELENLSVARGWQCGPLDVVDLLEQLDRGT